MPFINKLFGIFEKFFSSLRSSAAGVKVEELLYTVSVIIVRMKGTKERLENIREVKIPGMRQCRNRTWKKRGDMNFRKQEK